QDAVVAGVGTARTPCSAQSTRGRAVPAPVIRANGKMILGVGIDIIEVSRIADSHARFGERFLERILHANEISYCLSHRVPAPFLAARFAAKEAISKSFGT